MNKINFSYQLSRFFTLYLPGHLNVSKNTIASYRDTFTKLLRYFKDVKNVQPETLNFSHFNRKAIEDFLFYLESEQHCSISSRNVRLAGIKAFFRYVAVELPDYLELSRDIKEITNKKCPKPVIRYLTSDEVKILLEQPDIYQRDGRRDLAMLSILYDSGARVQELCDLAVSDFRSQHPSTIKLTGKGSKSRIVPLSVQNSVILQKYIVERKLDRLEKRDDPLFLNRQGKRLTRNGVSYILAKYVEQANSHSPHILPKITPHCLRHSKAMHLLESGVNLIYIRDFLGHEDIETTQIYAKANPETKRKAIENAYRVDIVPNMPDWNDDENLMEYLRNLV